MSRPRVDRPGTLVVVTGTGTEVGKTWVAAALLAELASEGLRCVARKPAQSFDPADPGARDAEVLAAATGEDPATVCPPHRNYAVAMAPPMAADALGTGAIEASRLLAEIDGSWPDPHAGPDGVEFALVELAGGVRSPMAHDADCAEFTVAMEPTHVVLVADAGLGTINAVRSALDSLAAAGALRPGGPAVTPYLNRFDDNDELHRRNRAWLADHGCGPIAVSPPELARMLVPRP
jgi:dethiobiotin synthetase